MQLQSLGRICKAGRSFGDLIDTRRDSKYVWFWQGDGRTRQENAQHWKIICGGQGCAAGQLAVEEEQGGEEKDQGLPHQREEPYY